MVLGTKPMIIFHVPSKYIKKNCFVARPLPHWHKMEQRRILTLHHHIWMALTILLFIRQSISILQSFMEKVSTMTLAGFSLTISLLLQGYETDARKCIHSST